LPIEQPMLFDLVVNMQTATALGLKVASAILVQATRVIE
jgi:putative tryptophan/tyrosine transport system substrate-binding protein